jgi:NDP-sugar pyrophosphorylase family protein
MKAMVLAAGLGTRLRPLTNERPKALVTLGGCTLLEITLRRLVVAGVTDVIVNAHHFAPQIEQFLAANSAMLAGLGIRVEISLEDKLLDTGGGLRHAAHFFLRNGEAGDEPFLVHNVDVLSSIDLAAMVQAHRERGALVTLAVQRRAGTRQLLFDEAGLLCGRHTAQLPEELVRPVATTQPMAFCGIHVLSPAVLLRLDHDDAEAAAFPIIPTYLRLAVEGARIVAYRADGCYWRDLGTIDALKQAEDDLRRGEIA